MNTKTLWMLALALGYTACSGVPGTDTTDKTGDDDDDTVGDDDDDDDTQTQTETADTSTTGTGGGYFRIQHLLIQADFGFNTTTGIVDAVSPYGNITPKLEIALGSPAWQADGFAFDSDAYCSVFLPLAQGPVPAFVTGTLWHGVAYDAANGAATTCTAPGYELDPASWGYEPDFGLANPDYYSWGVAVGEPWPAYEATYATGDLADFIIGGYIDNAFLPAPEGVEGYVGFATETDANNNIQIDGDGNLVLIPAADVPVLGLPAPLAQGWYQVFSHWIWSFENPI